MHTNSFAACVAAGGVIVADQLSKVLVAQPAHNPDYAFGVAGGPAPRLVAVALIVLAAFTIVATRVAAHLNVPAWTVAIIVAGSASNTLDRIMSGSVRDFIALPGAVCNLADIAVAVGVVAFVGASIRSIRALRVQPVR